MLLSGPDPQARYRIIKTPDNRGLHTVGVKLLDDRDGIGGRKRRQQAATCLWVEQYIKGACPWRIPGKPDSRFVLAVEG